LYKIVYKTGAPAIILSVQQTPNSAPKRAALFLLVSLITVSKFFESMRPSP
jgi:hypothetical protein